MKREGEDGLVLARQAGDPYVRESLPAVTFDGVLSMEVFRVPRTHPQPLVDEAFFLFFPASCSPTAYLEQQVISTEPPAARTALCRTESHGYRWQARDTALGRSKSDS